MGGKPMTAPVRRHRDLRTSRSWLMRRFSPPASQAQPACQRTGVHSVTDVPFQSWSINRPAPGVIGQVWLGSREHAEWHLIVSERTHSIRAGVAPSPRGHSAWITDPVESQTSTAPPTSAALPSLD